MNSVAGLSAHGPSSPNGVIAVSPAYSETLQRRYTSVRADRCVTIPFGASPADLDRARAMAWTNPFFTPADGILHGAYVGRGGADMRLASDILFRALGAATDAGRPRLQLSFIGTDYAPAATRKKTIEPVAAAAGLGACVREFPARVPYFEGLRVLLEADVLLILGSDDAEYSPSKIYPYLLAQKPTIAILHEASPIVDLVRRAGTGPVVTFREAGDVEAAAASLAASMRVMIDRLPYTPPSDLAVLDPFMARELTRRQCAMFDTVAGPAAA